MLDWLTDPNVMEVNDQIEKVNRKMFDKMTTLNENVAVLFGRTFTNAPMSLSHWLTSCSIRIGQSHDYQVL